MTAGTPSIPLTGIIRLERPVGATGTYAVVDSMSYDFSQLNYTSPTKTWYADIQRSNTPVNPVTPIQQMQAEWGCDSAAEFGDADPLTPSTTEFGNLGQPNTDTTAVVAGNPGVPLYDRFYSNYVAANALSGSLTTPFPNMQTTTLATDGYLFLNIDDVNCIAREGSYTTSAPAYEPLSAQIAANVATAGGMLYATDAQTAGYPMIAGTPSPEISEAALYFDFAYDPRAAYTAADSTLDTSGVPPTILSMTTLTDRSSNSANITATAAALPEGATDLVRQAGKVNINTAMPAVLYSIYFADGAMATDTYAQLPTDLAQLAADTIAFRERLSTGTQVPILFTTGVPTVPSPGYPASAPAGQPSYPGTGFRSTADLLLAFIPTVESQSGSPAVGLFPTRLPTIPTTIQQRDAAWADVENFITVRSDTFAVYGYVEGLRLNPNYTGTYAATDWYNANQGIAMGSAGSMSTDSTNVNAEFILEGDRRFIAIVDRSFCNNGTAITPHIVALKFLPK